MPPYQQNQNQPYSNQNQPTPGQQNPYEFIMNANHKPGRNFNFGNSTRARVVVVAVGVVLLIIMVMVVNSFLGRGDRAQTERLREIAQAQSELIRVSSLAKDKSKDIQTRSFAVNTKLSVESSQQQVKKSLANRGVNEKNLNKSLSASKNSKTDAALEEATKNNRFDDTFVAVINKQLTDYQKLLQNAHPTASPSEKKALTASFESAKQLTSKTASAGTQAESTSQPKE